MMTARMTNRNQSGSRYQRFVTQMKIGLEQIGAHYAISSIFRGYPEQGELFCYNVRRISHQVFTSGRGRVALGRVAGRHFAFAIPDDVPRALEGTFVAFRWRVEARRPRRP